MLHLRDVKSVSQLMIYSIIDDIYLQTAVNLFLMVAEQIQLVTLAWEIYCE